MNILSKAFGWLIGGGDAANKTIEAGTKMLDNAFYTDQEKGEAHGKLLDWYLKYQQSTAGQNVSRRIISFIVTILWAFLVLLGVGARYLESTHGANSISDFIFQTLKEQVNTPFEIIIGFYFLTHVLRGINNGK